MSSPTRRHTAAPASRPEATRPAGQRSSRAPSLEPVPASADRRRSIPKRSRPGHPLPRACSSSLQGTADSPRPGNDASERGGERLHAQSERASSPMASSGIASSSTLVWAFRRCSDSDLVMPTIKSAPDHGCERNEPRASTTAGSAQWRSSSKTTTGRSRASPSSTARAASSASPVPREPCPSHRSSNSRATRILASHDVRYSSPVATRSASPWIRRRLGGVADPPGEIPASSPMAAGERRQGRPASRTRSNVRR